MADPIFRQIWGERYAQFIQIFIMKKKKNTHTHAYTENNDGSALLVNCNGAILIIMWFRLSIESENETKSIPSKWQHKPMGSANHGAIGICIEMSDVHVYFCAAQMCSVVTVDLLWLVCGIPCSHNKRKCCALRYAKATDT